MFKMVSNRFDRREKYYAQACKASQKSSGRPRTNDNSISIGIKVWPQTAQRGHQQASLHLRALSYLRPIANLPRALLIVHPPYCEVKRAAQVTRIK